MAEVLELVPLVRLGEIISIGVSVARLRRIRRYNARTLFQVKRDVALQMDGVGEIIARREVNRPAACRRCGCNRFLDDCRVQTPAVALRTQRFHVEYAGSVSGEGGAR